MLPYMTLKETLLLFVLDYAVLESSKVSRRIILVEFYSFKANVNKNKEMLIKVELL